MKTYLQAKKALEAAQANLSRAERGQNATEIAAARTLVSAAHEDVIEAAGAEKALRAQHRAAIEAKALFEAGGTPGAKRTVEQPDSEPASSEPASSEEEEEEEESGPPASGNPDSGAPSTARSEEEGRKAKPPPKAKKKMQERRGEEEEEEEEEKALAACYAAADRAYRKEARARGVDAYGYRGPSALLKAVTKAHGTAGVHETFGALEGTPRQRAAAVKMEARVGALEANGRRERVKAVLDKARSEGRVITPQQRRELQALGEEKGSAWLKGYVATLPKLRTAADALAPEEGEDGRGKASAVRSKEQAAIIEQATAGMSDEERAEFEAALAGEMGKARTKAPVV